jgi:hypothetical protein
MTVQERGPLTSDILSVPCTYKRLLRAPYASQPFSCKHQGSRLPLNGLFFWLSFQVHSLDQASSIPSLPTQDSHFLHVHSAIPIPYFSTASYYCYSQCRTAGFLESSRLSCCRCSSHLMLLSGAHTGLKEMGTQFCCIPADLVSKIVPLRSTSLVLLVRAKSAESFRVALSLPSLPMRPSARNKMPLMALSVSYSSLQKYACPVDWSIRCKQAV